MLDNLIVEVGESLWGDRWQAEMARAIGVHKDTVRDWRQGCSTPRPGVYTDLLRIAVERAAAIDDVIEKLKRAGAP